MTGAADPYWMPPQSEYYLQGIPVVIAPSFGYGGETTFGGYAAYIASLDAGLAAAAATAQAASNPVVGVEQVGANTWQYNYADGTSSLGTDVDLNGINDLTTYSNGQVVLTDLFAGMSLTPLGTSTNVASSSGSFYATVNYGAYGLAGSTTQVAGGDLYQSFGIGTPGYSVETGYTAGVSTGLSINYSIPVGPGHVSGNVLDPLSGGYQVGGTFGQPGASLMYTVNATQVYNSSVAQVGTVYNAYANGIYSTQVAPVLPGYTQPPVYYEPSTSGNWLQQLYETVAAGVTNN